MDSAVPGPPGRAGGPEESIERRARFESAWRRYRPDLYRHCLRWMNGRREDAEDALGQTAIAAWQTIPRDLDPPATRAWLFRLAYTKCMDIHRERRRAPRLTTGVEDSLPDLASDAPPLESTVLNTELHIVVRRSIGQLAPRLRSVAELHVLREMQYAEIAELLAISEVNVRKRMQEVRAALRGPLRTYLAGEAKASLRSLGTAEAAGQAPRHAASPPRPSRWSIEAIRQYVHKHPRGWKKRWELASRLREAGLPEEAVLHYQGAASRQPRQPELWIELGETLSSLGRADDAIAAYKAGLRWARSEATRQSILARIALCRRDGG